MSILEYLILIRLIGVLHLGSNLKPTLSTDVDDSVRVKNALTWSGTLLQLMFLFDMRTVSRTYWERLVFESTLKAYELSQMGFLQSWSPKESISMCRVLGELKVESECDFDLCSFETN